MPSVSTKDLSSKAGIITTTDGERHIPASTRPDGTVRKEIRVRPGYRPPEDVEVYKNRTAEAWKTRWKGGVPGAEFVEPTNGRTTPVRTTRRNRSQKKGLEMENQEANEEQAQKRTENINVNPQSKSNNPEIISEAKVEVDHEEEREKEARKLTKKLRQAKELQKKKMAGGDLLPEQFEKVIRINELIRQLESLGFDSDGQKKP